jgi:hypothetical protein
MQKLYWIEALINAFCQKVQSIVSINNQIIKSLTLLN